MISDNNKYINSFLDYIDKERNFSKHTIRNYRIDLVSFSKFLNETDDSLSFIKIDRSLCLTNERISEITKNNMSYKNIFSQLGIFLIE